MRGFRRHDNPDILSLAVDASADQIQFTGILSGWGPGTLAEIESETVLVKEVDQTNKIATVVRGYLSTAAAHSLNTPIYLNPRMYRNDILDLFNDAIEDMFGKDLYAIDTQEIVYNPAIIGYGLNADVEQILRVDGLKNPDARYWEPTHDWLEVDNARVSDFPNSKAVMMRVALPPGSFRVVYAKRFTRIAAETDDLEANVGLRPYMTDLPFYYAMSRIMVDSERRRSQMETAQSHQRAQDSPAFLALRTGEWYQARYNDRVNVARASLLKETKKTIGAGFGS